MAVRPADGRPGTRWAGYRLALTQVCRTVAAYLSQGPDLSAADRTRLETQLQTLEAAWGDSGRVRPPLQALQAGLAALPDEGAVPARAGLNSVAQWLCELDEYVQS